MPKFSILRYEEEEEEEDEDQEICTRSPKRRTLNPPPSFSSISSPTAPFFSHQQSQLGSNNNNDCQADDDDDDDLSLDPTPTKSGGPISVILSDPDVLDCSICFDPLTIPVFQCDNGHIACSSCCKKLANKCPSCCGKIGNNRCRAIEKVIESIQVSCCYSKYGCQETITYCKRHEHEENCTYAPCSCPFSDCLFRGSPKTLSSHVNKKHADHVIHFRYGSAFFVSPRPGQSFIVFREERHGGLFILSHHGNSVAVRCIDSSLSTGKFEYEIVLRKGSTSLKFQSLARTVTGRFSDHISEDYVLVPGYFYTSDGVLTLEICISMKDGTPCASNSIT